MILKSFHDITRTLKDKNSSLFQSISWFPEPLYYTAPINKILNIKAQDHECGSETEQQIYLYMLEKEY